MKNKILLTGANGLIGKILYGELINKGYTINTLTRNINTVKNQFYWNIDKQEIDEKCFEGVTAVIHLAGENIGSKRWSESRKKEIINSRVDSTNLLVNTIKNNKNIEIKTFISASAVGYYGDNGDLKVDENSTNGEGFLAECCKLWEKASEPLDLYDVRVVKLRTGLVLSNNGGALPTMELPVKLFLGTPLGSGNQFVPWIHIKDLIDLYIYALENKNVKGPVNACTNTPERNKNFVKTIAQINHRPFWPIPVPSSLLKIILGESSELVLMSTFTTGEKALELGFQFKYNDLRNALLELKMKNE